MLLQAGGLGMACLPEAVLMAAVCAGVESHARQSHQPPPTTAAAAVAAVSTAAAHLDITHGQRQLLPLLRLLLLVLSHPG